MATMPAVNNLIPLHHKKINPYNQEEVLEFLLQCLLENYLDKTTLPGTLTWNEWRKNLTPREHVRITIKHKNFSNELMCNMNLSYIDFFDCKFTQANLENAILLTTRFFECNCNFINLFNAKLEENYFHNTSTVGVIYNPAGCAPKSMDFL